MIELKSPTKGKKSQTLGFGTPTMELKSQSLDLKTPIFRTNQGELSQRC
jgi:hypothetical protein